MCNTVSMNLGAGVLLVACAFLGTAPAMRAADAGKRVTVWLIPWLFCLRYIVPEERWSDRAAKISFWSLNIGLAWMVFATLFPLGVLQLYHSVSVGYFDARSLTYLTNQTNAFREWMRLPGDAVFIVGGVLPVLYLAWLGVRRSKPAVVLARPEDISL